MVDIGIAELELESLSDDFKDYVEETHEDLLNILSKWLLEDVQNRSIHELDANGKLIDTGEKFDALKYARLFDLFDQYTGRVADNSKYITYEDEVQKIMDDFAHENLVEFVANNRMYIVQTLRDNGIKKKYLKNDKDIAAEFLANCTYESDIEDSLKSNFIFNLIDIYFPEYENNIYE